MYMVLLDTYWNGFNMCNRTIDIDCLKSRITIYFLKLVTIYYSETLVHFKIICMEITNDIITISFFCCVHSLFNFNDIEHKLYLILFNIKFLY